MEETLKALAAFEAYSHHRGVTMQHYHTDNGRFTDRQFMEATSSKYQTVSFYGVNAHFQNGRAEQRIRDLQDQVRNVLLRSVARWPKSSSAHLWSYAVHYLNDVRNNIPTEDNTVSPLKKFIGTSVQTKVTTFYTFDCPINALNSVLESGKKLPKWDARCVLGLYLGNSPRHIRSVSQVFKLDTDRVSSQFRVIHDEFFGTIAL